MAQTCWEIDWILGIFSDLRVNNLTHVSLYCDNKATIQIVVNSIFHERTKYIEIDCHLIRNHLNKGVITTNFVCSYVQLVDMFTKTLSSLNCKICLLIWVYWIHFR